LENNPRPGHRLLNNKRTRVTCTRKHLETHSKQEKTAPGRWKPVGQKKDKHRNRGERSISAKKKKKKKQKNRQAQYTL